MWFPARKVDSLRAWYERAGWTHCFDVDYLDEPACIGTFDWTGPGDLITGIEAKLDEHRMR